VATPLVLGLAYAALGGGPYWKELSLALIMQAAAPPITSAPAFVALVGLDVALALAALITTHAITPLTAPFFAALFAPDALPLDATALAIRLGLYLGGSYLVARLIRQLAGPVRATGWRAQIDGVNVILLFVFAAALMESVSARVFEEPWLVVALLALSFLVTFGLMAATTLLFWAAGPERALSLGMASGTRNMGLMLAAAAGVSDIVWLYFAVAQFPIYLAPQILSPLVSRILRSRLPPGR
jgi:BASS family bile acid:Na+ symporter